MFQRSLDIVEECDITWLHVFPYSERAGTPAARMPQVPVELRRERAARLRHAGDAAARRFLAGRIGTNAMLLVERNGAGRTEHYAPLRIATEASATEGALVAVRVTKKDERGLIGTPLARHAA